MSFSPKCFRCPGPPREGRRKCWLRSCAVRSEINCLRGARPPRSSWCGPTHACLGPRKGNVGGPYPLPRIPLFPVVCYLVLGMFIIRAASTPASHIRPLRRPRPTTASHLHLPGEIVSREVMGKQII